MLAAHGRPDPVQRSLSDGERALLDSGVTLPPRDHAGVAAQQNLSRRTLRDAVAVQDWLDLLEIAGPRSGPGVRAQLDLLGTDGPEADRLPAYRAITVPSLVVGFTDDVMLSPHLTREVADAIPGARHVELTDCGHLGYLERPATVNELVLDFFATARPVRAPAARPVA